MAKKNGNMDLSIPADPADKEKALEQALNQIQKTYGAGSIMKLSDGAINDGIEAISTGSLSLDVAMGIGGVPRGRIVEIY